VPSCIFHHPFPIRPDGRSGSGVRPYRMRQAFRDTGYDVLDVSGDGRTRAAAAREALRRVRDGERFDFVYSETHTLPTLLTEAHHVPTHPNLDHGLFSALRRAGVPIGLFYRDLHWRFEQYRHASTQHRLVAPPLYRYDWWRYRRSVDVLFLPSMEMAAHLPSPWPADRIVPLPPGVQIVDDTPSLSQPSEGATPLRLFYVGGVTAPLYDLRPLFDMLGSTPAASLTLCCREDEWRRQRAGYTVPPNVHVVHAAGAELLPLYREADAFAILWRQNPYLSFAMPVKLFEALGHGLPVITTPGTAVSAFVRERGVGWLVDTAGSFVELASRLARDPGMLSSMRDQVRSVAQTETWEARARTVASHLMRRS
jgi:glycosyltransferase involved in cell wall biosynthesis